MRGSLLPLLVVAAADAQDALLLRDGNLAALPAGGGPRAVIERLLALPGEHERALGYTTAIPRGIRLLECAIAGTSLTLTFDAGLLRLLHPQQSLEQALEQLEKTALRSGPFERVELLVRTASGTRRFADLLPRPPLAPEPPRDGGGAPQASVAGALFGKTIVVSPGHGYYRHSTLGWTTQRGAIDGLTEDIHTNEICMRQLIPHLENMGARVISCRERGEVPVERVVDNDAGAPAFVETGAWSTSAGNGWNGSTYRFAPASGTANATATWTVPVAADGIHPVYVIYRAGSNRAGDARYTIHHSGGATVVTQDQRRWDLTWVHLGDFHFTALGGARVTLDNQSAGPGNVIADAVRVGAGVGSIPRLGTTSGRPRWQECARTWTQFAGAPASVYDSISGGEDNDDDVTARPRYAEWLGHGDAYVSLHTNAGGGAGTETFIYSGGATPGSAALQAAVQARLIGELRSFYDPAWVDRGLKQANFGEVRVLSTMPGILVELAFHDTPSSLDHRALHDPRFRRIAGRAIARGVLRYFQPSAPFPPDAPEALRVTQDGAGGLRVAWDAAAGATGYSIEWSANGKGFVEAAQTSSPDWHTGPLPPGAVLSFRVRAFNATGRSTPTEVLAAGTSHDRRAELLLVNGFDRFDRYVKEPENTQDYLARHGEALRRDATASLGFDAASNEAVQLGRVALAGYRAACWALGEESTQHETFGGVEQALVAAYLQQGGRLFVSGAELAWDLDRNGGAADRAFLRGALGAAYVADDANSYAFRGSGGVYAALAGGTFDDGQRGTYHVDYADVLAPADAFTTACLTYGSGGTAGLQRDDGTSRVVVLGFPLETIVEPDVRAQVLQRALRFLLAPRALECPPDAPLQQALPIDVRVPADAGQPYLLAASVAPGAIPLPGGGILPLAADGVFLLSLTQNNGVFGGFAGVLDGQGRASATFAVPPLPILRGIHFWFAGLTLQGPQPLERTVLPWTRTTVR
jgi:N-acetylmuramoyl-L-alanine amidase